MHHRRTRVLAVGALLLATPALSSCGFNYATDRINTTQHGATNRDKSVDVLAAVIVAEKPGSGTLSARLVNNDQEATELTAIEGSEAELSVTALEPTEIPPSGALAAADLGDGIRIDGDFIPGNIVSLTMTFSNGDQVPLEVPVVKACDEYAEVEQAPEIEAEPTEGEPTEGEESEAASGTESAETYSCETHDEGGH